MKRRVLTVMLAVLLAVLGTVGVLAYVHQADARAVAGMRSVTTLVAQQQIPAGTSASAALSAGLLSSQTLPASSVPSDAIHSITPGLGALVVSADVQPGQLLLRPMLVTAAQVTGAGALAIPKGMVAVTVPFCLPEAVAGYVHPGLQVAVFDTYSSKALSADCSGSHQQQTGVHTRLVLPRVEVLSVGPAAAQSASTANSTALSASQASPGTSTQGPVLVTFAVNQADAERLILLNESGLPYLALLTGSSQTVFDAVQQPLFRP